MPAMKRKKLDMESSRWFPKGETCFQRWYRSFLPPEDGKPQKLKRTLTARHIQMIGIGGAIGTGVWVGSKNTLREGGAASVLICYSLVGSMVLMTVYSLGELAVAFPINGSFHTYGTRFIHPSWGFTLGWNYLASFLATYPLELITASICLQFWININSGIWITVFIALLCFVNMFGVRGYGEVEFFVSSLKVMAMVGFIICGIVIDCGGVRTDHRGYIGATIFRKNAFIHGFHGFCSVFSTAAFSYAGTEYIGIAASETKNPAKAFPKAVKQVFIRVSLFYILALFVVSLLISGRDERLTTLSATAASPFILALMDAKIRGLPHVLNAVILISVLTAANGITYTGSRTLHSMAEQGHAPKWFKYVDREGRPLLAMAFVLCFGALGYICESAQSDTVFDWLLSISNLATLFVWLSINVSYIIYRLAFKKQGKSYDEVGYHSPFGIYGACYGAFIIILVFITEFYVSIFPIGASPDAGAFFQSYLCFPVVVIVFIAHALITRQKFRKLSEIDLDTGFSKYDRLEESDKGPMTAKSLAKSVLSFCV
nr:unnamed protein product [Schizosaccharomyces pombe]